VLAPVRDRASFAAFRTAPSGRSGPIRVRFLAGSEPEVIRLAFVLPKRTGNAVLRNRIRRRLRAAFSELVFAERLPAGAYLIGATAAAAEAPYPTLLRHLERAAAAANRSAGVVAP
jgi:ribonuclease P protein component